MHWRITELNFDLEQHCIGRWPSQAGLSNKCWATFKTTWLDGAKVSALDWGSGGPRFQSHPRLPFQSCSHYQLNQLGSKTASESTFKKSNTCRVSNTRLYFALKTQPDKWHHGTETDARETEIQLLLKRFPDSGCLFFNPNWLAWKGIPLMDG